MTKEDWRKLDEARMLKNEDIIDKEYSTPANVLYKQLHKYNTLPLRRKSRMELTYSRENVSLF